MDYIQVHHALREVRDLKRNILDKQRFKGYSGRARALDGCVALAAVPLVGMATPGAPSVRALFVTWGVVFALAVAINFGSLLYWFLHDGRRELQRMRPALETLPVWVAGGAITVALWRNGQHDLLYGMWMCLFGLAQGMIRSVLPRAILWVGVYYLVAGFCCLLWYEGIFLRPWIMGGVFFVGEWAAGFVIHFEGSPARLAASLGLAARNEDSA